MFKYILSLMVILAFSMNADAAVKIKNNNVQQYEEGIAGETGGVEPGEAETIATLENDIAILDEEIAKCQKQKKGWIAATVIGSAGVVSTGIAAAVQGVKIKDKKETLEDKNDTLKSLKDEKKRLDDK